MGRSLTDRIDLGAVRVAAIGFVLVACMIALVLGVAWAWRVSGGPIEVGKAFSLLLVLGAPILGILICGVLARPGPTSGLARQGAVASLSTDDLEVRIASIAARLGQRVSREVDRAETAGVDLRATQSSVQMAADRAREALTDLSDVLARIDSLSKETTSAVAKRAYALDAAVEGVLRRAVNIFDAIDDRIVSRTAQFESRISDVSDRLAHVDAGPRAEPGGEFERLGSDLQGPVAGLKALTEIATAAAFVMGDFRTNCQNGQIGEHGLSSRWRNAVQTVIGQPETSIAEALSNDSSFRDEADRFFVIFERLMGCILSLPSGNITASRILSSNFGRSYVAIARSAGRLK